MRQVLIFDTAIATTNIGDEIIMEGCKNALAPLLKESLCFRLGTHIENFFPIKIKKNWKIRNICDKSDYKFIFGTNCLAGKFNIFGSGQWKINWFTKRLYKNVILVGVGRMGNYNKPRKYTQLIYKNILSHDYYHSVRDDETKRVLEEMGFKVINTGCPTLWSLTPEKCKLIPKKKASKCILSVSGYRSQQNRDLDQQMIYTIKNNYKKCYAWIQTTVDEEYLRSLNDTDDIECIYSLEKYGEILDNGNIDYIGTRLHGGIFALQHNCRSIIISIDERARGFKKSNNIPILEREEIAKLNSLINSEIKTEIKINKDAIDKFLSQFQ